MTFKHDEFDSDTRLSKESLKQRLIGAIVLISLAVIFLPMIFDQPHVPQKDLIIPIPEQPPKRTIVIDAAEKPEMPPQNDRNKEIIAALSAHAEASPTTEVASEKGGNSVKKDLEKAVVKQLDSDKPSIADPVESRQAEAQPELPTGSEEAVAPNVSSSNHYSDKAAFKGKWMVQVGSFSSSERAFRLAREIRSRGFSAHVIPIQSGGKKLSKVLAGPFLEESSARSAKKTLDRFFRVKSIVVKY